VESIYDAIMLFFKEYIADYSKYGQTEETIHVMDKYYATDLSFPDDMVIGREQWYKRCLNHPGVQDKLSLEHIVIDEKKHEVAALLKTEAIDRKTGNILMELRMNALYTLRISKDKDIKITAVRIFLESNPEKTQRLALLYKIGM
jgi:hypothetical protein